MSIQAHCPSCDFKKPVHDSLDGHKARCPKCGEVFTIGLDSLAEVVDVVEATPETSPAQPAREERRGYKRVKPQTTLFYLQAVGDCQPLDISVSGARLDISDMDWDFQPDRVYVADIYQRKQLLLAGVNVKVVRVDAKSIGCAFQDLGPDEMALLRDAVEREELLRMVRRNKGTRRTITDSRSKVVLSNGRDMYLPSDNDDIF
jgi:hypothetical protein